jgi:hypothetical protein
MSLASDCAAKSAVELSLSALFHYQYSSISKAVANISRDAESCKRVSEAVRRLQLSFLGEALQGRVRLVTDCTPIPKRHSHCLEGRQYVAVASGRVLDNKPIEVGIPVSSVQLGCGRGWCLPLDQSRLGPEASALDTAVGQISALLEKIPLGDGELAVNTADSAYGTPRFLAPLYGQDSLVNVVRLRSGMKVWTQDRRSGTGGASRIYGECLYLTEATCEKAYTRNGRPYAVRQRSIRDLPAAESCTFAETTAKGRRLEIRLARWDGLLRRAKKEHSMKHKPIDVVCVDVRDAATGEAVFQRPMFLAVSGGRKAEVGTRQAYSDYRGRFDIEHNFRFQKQHLLLQGYHTPDVRTLDNWMLAVQLANTLLFLASGEAAHTCHKWQQYGDKPPAQGQRLTPCQTKKAAQRLFKTFGKSPFLPLKCKKGNGRAKGTVLAKRERRDVARKGRKTPG